MAHARDSQNTTSYGPGRGGEGGLPGTLHISLAPGGPLAGGVVLVLRLSGQGRAWGVMPAPPRLSPTQECPRRRAVILKFSLQGLKMYSGEGEVGAHVGAGDD